MQEDPSAECRFSCRSSSTKLALYGHHRRRSPRKTVLLVPHRFPSSLLCYQTSLFPIVVIISCILPRRHCHVFDSNRLRSGMAHKCACSKCIGRWPISAWFRIICAGFFLRIPPHWSVIVASCKFKLGGYYLFQRRTRMPSNDASITFLDESKDFCDKKSGQSSCRRAKQSWLSGVCRRKRFRLDE